MLKLIKKEAVKMEGMVEGEKKDQAVGTLTHSS